MIAICCKPSWKGYSTLCSSLYADPNPRGLEHCSLSGNAKNESLGGSLFRRTDDFWQLCPL